MGSQLCVNWFDIEACCVTMLPSRKKGESLVLPNLKLKVLIEAIRLVLEIVYDERFVTFSYGGRVGMGRHTAIMSLKNSVENPSWWFSVTFDRDRTWTDEVVQDFLGSLEERWEWHRMLTAGDFLSLRHIRDQLPQELVDAYDKFQEQVDKYLSPVQSRKALKKEEKRVEEEEEQKYAKSMVEDLKRLPIKLLIALEDTDIIKWYAGVARRWLDFFCCCHNFKMVKTVVTYHLRFSCILTLAEKHESTKREAIKHYTKDLKVSDFNGNEDVYFPTEREVKMMGDQNISDPRPVDGALSLALIRLASDEPSCSCIGHFCDRMDTVYYRVQLLQNRLNVNPSVEDKWVTGMGAIHESLNQKCLPLCSHHINDLYMGNITLQDIDCTSFVDVD
uniref:Domain X domain-containing protein n=1 Tax=Quercus lobata TaxID=97700 RepID=A0A7N2M405_QUELO